MSVLILDAEVFYAVPIVQSLGRQRIPVDLASRTGDGLAFSSRYRRHHLPQSESSVPDEFCSWLRRLDADNGYHLIIPAAESSLAFIAALPADDPLRKKCLLPAADAVFTALDKEQTRALARQCGLLVPGSRFITKENVVEASQAGTTPAFPLILKPYTSRVWKDGRLLFLHPKIVRNPEERLAVLQNMLRLTPVLEQEFVPGHGFGIDLLYENGHLLWQFAHERMHEVPLTGGASTYRRSIATPPKLLHAAKSLLDRLNWHGWAMVEFRGQMQSQTFHLMEINPRAWGSIGLSIKAGADFPHALYQLACGKTPGPQPDYHVDHYARSVIRDVEWFAANLKADHGNPMLLTRPRLNSFCELFRPLAGTESWDDFDWGDLSITVRTVGLAFATFLRKLFRREKAPVRD